MDFIINFEILYLLGYRWNNYNHRNFLWIAFRFLSNLKTSSMNRPILLSSSFLPFFSRFKHNKDQYLSSFSFQGKTLGFHRWKEIMFKHPLSKFLFRLMSIHSRNLRIKSFPQSHFVAIKKKWKPIPNSIRYIIYFRTICQ